MGSRVFFKLRCMQLLKCSTHYTYNRKSCLPTQTSKISTKQHECITKAVHDHRTLKISTHTSNQIYWAFINNKNVTGKQKYDHMKEKWSRLNDLQENVHLYNAWINNACGYASKFSSISEKTCVSFCWAEKLDQKFIQTDAHRIHDKVNDQRRLIRRPTACDWQ